MNNGSSYTTQNVNSASIKSTSVALSSNTARIGWSIQNLGTNPLYVLLGTGATTSTFHVVLKGSTAQDDGSGGSVGQEQGVIWNGEITVGGTSVRYVPTEFAP